MSKQRKGEQCPRSGVSIQKAGDSGSLTGDLDAGALMASPGKSQLPPVVLPYASPAVRKADMKWRTLYHAPCMPPTSGLACPALPPFSSPSAEKKSSKSDDKKSGKHKSDDKKKKSKK